MTMSQIILASAFAGAAAVPESHENHDGHATGYAPIDPAKLGGSYEFQDVKGRKVTSADFEGHWTLLFFGYSRCKGSCPVATPKIVKAARMLREKGVEAKAVFVDIEAPPLGIVKRNTGEQANEHAVHDHGDMNRIAAMRALAGTYDGELQVLSGTRGQLSNAARAFLVQRQHMPPRKGEEGHSINHTTRIYFIGPDTKVAGYGFHDSDPMELVDAIDRLSGTRGA